MNLNTTSLLDLPPELILEIHDHLSLDALLALKLTHPRLHQIIRLDRQRWQSPLSHCSHRAIQLYLALSTAKASHRFCRLCAATIPVSMFNSSTSPAFIQAADTDDFQNIIELPPGICALHVSRLMRVVHTGPRGPNEWTSTPSRMCMHCGNIEGWADCDCKCDSCAVGIVKTFTRYLNNTRECQQYRFWKADSPTNKTRDGHLWVRETVMDERDHYSIINLPIRPMLDEATTMTQHSQLGYGSFFRSSFWL
ncbi:F-box domain containing protein [Pyrenophora tritici-repentis]|nr:F-box domain containing protein [Pyrenophora tritici-repentis]